MMAPLLLHCPHELSGVHAHIDQDEVAFAGKIGKAKTLKLLIQEGLPRPVYGSRILLGTLHRSKRQGPQLGAKEFTLKGSRTLLMAAITSGSPMP